MAYEKTEHRQTVDYKVFGELPVEQPFSMVNSKIDPRNLRVTIVDGQMENIVVYGLKYNATGKLGKGRYSFPIGEKQYAPAWVDQIITELGLSWDNKEEAA